MDTVSFRKASLLIIFGFDDPINMVELPAYFSRAHIPWTFVSQLGGAQSQRIVEDCPPFGIFWRSDSIYTIGRNVWSIWLEQQRYPWERFRDTIPDDFPELIRELIQDCCFEGEKFASIGDLHRAYVGKLNEEIGTVTIQCQHSPRMSRN
jgi:hypothetical protein